MRNVTMTREEFINHIYGEAVGQPVHVDRTEETNGSEFSPFRLGTSTGEGVTFGYKVHLPHVVAHYYERIVYKPHPQFVGEFVVDDSNSLYAVLLEGGVRMRRKFSSQ